MDYEEFILEIDRACVSRKAAASCGVSGGPRTTEMLPDPFRNVKPKSVNMENSPQQQSLRRCWKSHLNPEEISNFSSNEGKQLLPKKFAELKSAQKKPIISKGFLQVLATPAQSMPPPTSDHNNRGVKNEPFTKYPPQKSKRELAPKWEFPLELDDSHQFDKIAGARWIYPVSPDRPKREYQFRITEKALLTNTLVCLPTGLGKTLIAAVVMLNFFRWFPKGKIVFLAPTKPLVSQQMAACHGIARIPVEAMVCMTGNTPIEERATLWQSKSVFFMTGQTLQKDIKEHRICPHEAIVCLVVDEAHKASGRYAYCIVVEELVKAGVRCRILALTATPGATHDKVQELVDNLQISNLELRDESDVDVRQYTFHRVEELKKVPVQSDMKEIENLLHEELQVHTKYLMQAVDARIPSLCHSYVLQMKKAEFEKARMDEGGLRESDQYTLHSFVNAHFLAHLAETLLVYGTGSALKKYLENKDGRVKLDSPKLKEVYRRMLRIREKGLASPKLTELETVVLKHFKKMGPDNTKVIVFTNLRESVMEIVDVLNARHSEGVKAKEFIGQQTGKFKGISQKRQIALIQDFREGHFNVLVATSIGEEGLDISQVDLVVAFDCMSVGRMTQRMGRTGRQRDGKVIILASEGGEYSKYKREKDKGQKLARTIRIQGADLLQFHDSPRMVPHACITPEAFEQEMTVSHWSRHALKHKWEEEQPPSGRRKKTKTAVDAQESPLVTSHATFSVAEKEKEGLQDGQPVGIDEGGMEVENAGESQQWEGWDWATTAGFVVGGHSAIWEPRGESQGSGEEEACRKPTDRWHGEMRAAECSAEFRVQEVEKPSEDDDDERGSEVRETEVKAGGEGSDKRKDLIEDYGIDEKQEGDTQPAKVAGEETYADTEDLESEGLMARATVFDDVSEHGKEGTSRAEQVDGQRRTKRIHTGNKFFSKKSLKSKRIKVNDSGESPDVTCPAKCIGSGRADDLQPGNNLLSFLEGSVLMNPTDLDCLKDKLENTASCNEGLRHMNTDRRARGAVCKSTALKKQQVSGRHCNTERRRDEDGVKQGGGNVVQQPSTNDSSATGRVSSPQKQSAAIARGGVVNDLEFEEMGENSGIAKNQPVVEQIQLELENRRSPVEARNSLSCRFALSKELETSVHSRKPLMEKNIWVVEDHATSCSKRSRNLQLPMFPSSDDISGAPEKDEGIPLQTNSDAIDEMWESPDHDVQRSPGIMKNNQEENEIVPASPSTASGSMAAIPQPEDCIQASFGKDSSPIVPKVFEKLSGDTLGGKQPLPQCELMAEPPRDKAPSVSEVGMNDEKHRIGSRCDSHGDSSSSSSLPRCFRRAPLAKRTCRVADRSEESDRGGHMGSREEWELGEEEKEELSSVAKSKRRLRRVGDNKSTGCVRRKLGERKRVLDPQLLVDNCIKRPKKDGIKRAYRRTKRRKRGHQFIDEEAIADSDSCEEEDVYLQGEEDDADLQDFIVSGSPTPSSACGEPRERETPRSEDQMSIYRQSLLSQPPAETSPVRTHVKRGRLKFVASPMKFGNRNVGKMRYLPPMVDVQGEALLCSQAMETKHLEEESDYIEGGCAEEGKGREGEDGVIGLSEHEVRDVNKCGELGDTPNGLMMGLMDVGKDMVSSLDRVEEGGEEDLYDGLDLDALEAEARLKLECKKLQTSQGPSPSANCMERLPPTNPAGNEILRTVDPSSSPCQRATRFGSGGGSAGDSKGYICNLVSERTSAHELRNGERNGVGIQEGGEWRERCSLAEWSHPSRPKEGTDAFPHASDVGDGDDWDWTPSFQLRIT